MDSMKITICGVILFTLILLGCTPILHKVFSISPSVGYRVFKNEPYKVVDIKCVNAGNNTNDCIGPENKGNQSLDIQEIHYFSDGITLNATLWLLSPFNESSFKGHVVSYGIYIDADSNNSTGNFGVDYQLEISLENGTWNKKLFTYSSLGGNELLLKEEKFSPHITKNGDYIPLSVNLNSMGFPPEYRLMFYSEEDYDDHTPFKMDFTGWMDVPSQQFTVATNPSPIVLSQGDKQLFNIDLESSSSLVPSNISFILDSKLVKSATGLDMKFIYGQPKAYNAGPSALQISAPKDSALGKYTIPIIADISRTTLSPISPPTIFLPFIPPNHGNELRDMTLQVTVIKPKDISEKLQDINKTWIEPLSGIYTFIIGLFTGGISQFIYKRITKKGG